MNVKVGSFSLGLGWGVVILTWILPAWAQEQTQNCGDNVDCLLTAAEQCQPTQARFRSSFNQNGISGTGVTYLLIQGPVAEGCQTYSRIESISDLDFSGLLAWLGNTPGEVDTLLIEFLQQTENRCIYTSGRALQQVLAVDLNRQAGTIGVAQLQPVGNSTLEGPMTLEGKPVAQCQIQLPENLGGVPFDFRELF